nr:extracellular solute-binding protein [Clostridia bacterium]
MKKLAMLLLCAMLISTAAACSSGSTDTGTPSDDTTAANAQTEVTEPVDPNMPEFETKYGGKDFRVIYPTHANFQYQHSDTETGDSVEDALYKRDITIEDQFEVDMKYTVVDQIKAVYDTVSQNILAGDDSFDLILNHVNWQINAYIAEKFVLDWYTVNNVDLEKPYWNQNMNDSLAIGDVLPVAASDYVVANPLMIFFNTELVKSMGLDDQYELVNSGKWTWDELIATSSKVMTDINGDGTMNADDRYGFVVDITGSSYMLRSIPASANQFIYSKGNDGSLNCTVNTPQMQTLLEKMVSLFNGGGGYLLNYGAPQDNVKAVAHFNKGTTLYYLVDSLKAFAYRDIDFEYGILPLPK